MAAEKTYDYIVTLKRGRHQSSAFDVISHILLFLAFASTAYYTINLYFAEVNAATFFGRFTAPNFFRQSHIAAIVLTLAIGGTWLYGGLKKKFRIGIWVAGLVWMFIFQQYLIGVLYIIAGLVEKYLKQPAEIGFDKAGAVINAFPRRAYQWNEINNVIMKDGILTVDLKNNKIIQKEMETDTTPEIEKEFNEFSRSHLLSV